MKVGREGGRSPATRPGGFNPWAPRQPGSGPAPAPAPPTPSPATGGPGPLVAGGTRWVTDHTSAPAPLTAELGGRPPVADDDRPPGAPPQPPTSWPAPRLPGGPDDPGEGRSRGGVLAIFGAFLVGALLIGAAFAAYALGDRGAKAATDATTTTATNGLGATGPLDIRKVLGIIQPSVVSIQTGSADSVFGGAGSGVIISEDGLILTNAHVIEGAGGKITVRFHDGQTAPATVVGSSTDDDIALIQADRRGLQAAALGSSSNLLVGEDVVAIGNALNLGGDPSVTRGIVSAKDRSIDDGVVHLDHLIQTDAAINPGNSGGPLVNANGEVVGINTAIIAGAQNVGFSIAIDSVKPLIEELKNGGGTQPTGAKLGASALDVTSPSLDQSVRDQFGITESSGAVVTYLEPAGAASSAGIDVGDVILSLDGTPIATANDLVRAVRGHKPGDKVTIELHRGGNAMTVTATLGG